jgi:hypothetical protein
LQSLNSGGLNCLLEGVEKSAKMIAENVENLSKQAEIQLPVRALVGFF